MNKHIVAANDLLRDSFQLAADVYESGFRPDFLVGLWRGGSAVVTKGVIDTNRRSVMLANADIVATGHIHESWEMPLMRKHLSTRTGKEE